MAAAQRQAMTRVQHKQSVLSAYCDQSSTAAFPTPTIAVSQYITDVAEFQYLAPCAASGLSNAVQYNHGDIPSPGLRAERIYTDDACQTYKLCPPDATALATCACEKNQNSILVSQAINSAVKYDCASHTADVSSAQAMFAAYCAMNNGTSLFPTASSPPGDMTYYITDLPQYTSLAPCAGSAVSYAVAEPSPTRKTASKTASSGTKATGGAGGGSGSGGSRGPKSLLTILLIIAALVISMIVLGIVCCKKHKLKPRHPKPPGTPGHQPSPGTSAAETSHYNIMAAVGGSHGSPGVLDHPAFIEYYAPEADGRPVVNISPIIPGHSELQGHNASRAMFRIVRSW
ncbi:hypothetical protein VMCG_03315 [Cytospora schulzeri]|uniref:Uncharacterized protein n=1 Tax=Cytospora schulzeri TaxID=448051 RepID=A0A423WXZ6_9PEZI|nr:hypothetical protein VMCG_03315 [Valsa malicola]